MSQRRPFYSKFVWKDWITDTLDLTPEQAGIYIRLLAYAATNSPDCSSLPDDETKLSRAAGVSLKTWRRVAGPVMVKWIRGPAGWENKRLRSDWVQYSQLCERQRLRRTTGAPDDTVRCTRTPPRAVARELDSDSEESKSKHLSAAHPNGPSPMTPARTPRPAARPESESFREFYADWPRPTQRLRAWKAWQAALKRNPGTDEAGILAASWEWAGYFADEKREPMHIPHPATWLNGNLFLEVPR